MIDPAPANPTEDWELTEEHQARLRLRSRSGRPLGPADLEQVLGLSDLSPESVAFTLEWLSEAGIPYDDGFGAEFSQAPTNNRTAGRRMGRASAGGTTSIADPVRSYLREIGTVPLLQGDEEIVLAERIAVGAKASSEMAELIESGQWPRVEVSQQRRLRRAIADGVRAREELTAANLRLVVSIAKRYSGRSLPMLDLIQEGNLGLMRAVEKFDHTKGFKFSTYATWWIRQSISRALADQSRTIRVPVHMVESMNAVIRAQRDLAQRLERDPTLAELAADVDMTEERVVEILQIAQQDPLSLDSPVGDEDDASMADFIPDGAPAPVELIGQRLLRDALSEALDDLGDRESEVVRLRFGLVDGRPHTLEEVGRAFGVTRERIRQIETKTLAKLRHPLRSEPLRDYLED